MRPFFVGKNNPTQIIPLVYDSNTTWLLYLKRSISKNRNNQKGA